MEYKAEKTIVKKNKTHYLYGYLGLSLLFLLDFFAIQYYKVSLVGYWPDRVLFWLWFLATLVFIPLFWKSIFTKLYMTVLLAGLMLSIAAMMIPFFGIVFSSTGIERVGAYTLADGKYRLQIIQSVMGRPRLEVIERKFFLEKVVINSDTDFLANERFKLGQAPLLKVELIAHTQDSLHFKFYTIADVVTKAFPFDHLPH